MSVEVSLDAGTKVGLAKLVALLVIGTVVGSAATIASQRFLPEELPIAGLPDPKSPTDQRGDLPNTIPQAMLDTALSYHRWIRSDGRYQVAWDEPSKTIPGGEWDGWTISGGEITPPR